MKYAGLTDDLARRRQEHGDPPDWRYECTFATEIEARAWERKMLAEGYEGRGGGEGWRFGYTYTITPQTRQ
jgi:hypothetical protein